MEIKEITRYEMNIYEKLSSISNKLSTVAKNLEVGFGANKYKAVGEADVLKAVKPLEAEFGVYSYPHSRSIIESGEIESVNAKGEVKKQFFERIETVYRFVNIDKPEEFVDITTYGDGIDSQDKSVGKAMTYGDKYALLKAYKIVTGDDPDQNASEDLKGSNLKKTARAKEELDERLLAQCDDLNIELAKVATYLKKDVSLLTNDDLKKCIDQKKKALGGQK